MESDSISIFSLVATVGVAMLTVFVTDFFGLRRDKARLKMEFAWQLRRQRWDALYSALQSCPRFVAEPNEMLQSISNLANWSATQVEPWIGSDRVKELRVQRESVEAWVIDTLQAARDRTENEINIPREEINAFRDFANQQLSEALQRIRSEYSPLLKDQKF